MVLCHLIYYLQESDIIKCQALIRRVDQLPVYLLLLFLKLVFFAVVSQLWRPIAPAAVKEGFCVAVYKGN